MFALLAGLCLSAEVYIMAPLAILNADHSIPDYNKIDGWLDKLQAAKVDGVMLDVWWGLVETSPKSYKWDGYNTLFQLLKNHNLKIVPVMSFHKCGGNVGDACDIQLPSFVTSSSLQPFYTDESGNVNNEYISLGFDDVVIDGSRTPIQMYKDFMTAFASNFKSYLDDGTIAEVEVGVGPCGELRYPSYPSHLWSYPGCGAFQAYDSGMTEMLQKDAAAAGVSSYAHHPYNTGGYNAQPNGATFWTQGQADSWDSAYGKWYQEWYSSKLIAHGGKIYEVARQAFGSKVELSSKISGIHWWYMVPSHCAELTAGLRNYQDYDGYRDIFTEFKKYEIQVCFTCLEMTAKDSYCSSNPPYLVGQVAGDAAWAGLKFEGENALECYDSGSLGRVKAWTSQGLVRYTHLRMGDSMMADGNWNTFVSFVNDMHNA